MAFRDQPLGELALTIPRASALFRQYDMDYCCGGKQTLARASRGDYRPYHRSLSRPAP